MGLDKNYATVTMLSAITNNPPSSHTFVDSIFAFIAARSALVAICSFNDSKSALVAMCLFQ